MSGPFRRALELHQAGHFEQAAHLYRDVPARDPAYSEARHMLGVLALQAGQLETALQFIDESLSLSPRQALALANAGGALIGLQRHADALQRLDSAVAIDPGLVVAHFNRGVALRLLGRSTDALAAFDRVLELDPARVDALVERGRLLRALQRDAEAIASFEAALKLRPASFEARLGLGNALLTLGRMGNALESLESALTLRPESAAALNSRAMALGKLGRLEEALADCDRALRVSPSHALALANRGTILRRLGRLEEALASYDSARIAEPGSIAALTGRAMAFTLLGRWQDCLRDCDEATHIDPACADAHVAAGLALVQLGQPEEARSRFLCALESNADLTAALSARMAEIGAIRNATPVVAALPVALMAFDEALARSPSNARALASKGEALLALGEPANAAVALLAAADADPGMLRARVGAARALAGMNRQTQALAHCDAALRVDPNGVDAWTVRGMIQLNRDPQDSLASFDRALEIDPSCFEARFNRCVTLGRLGRHDEAEQTLERLLPGNEDQPYLRSMLLRARLAVCDWRDYEEHVEAIRSAVRAGQPAILPWTFLLLPGTAAEQLTCARTYAGGAVTDRRLRCGEPYAHDRVRIAYLSADFHEHATSHLAAGLFERHDRRRFEVHAVSYGPDHDDAMRRRLRDAFDGFHDLRDAGDEEIARWLREQEFDIAVDLKGHTRGARPGILARRPCPVQVAFLGYPGTLGTDSIDYLIADEHVIPPPDREHYSERIVYLPDSYQVNDSTRPVPHCSATRSEFGLPESGFVFCCLGNGHKIAPDVFASWMRILDAVPGAVLWLLSSGERAEANLRRSAEQLGVDPQRMVFAQKLPQAEHLARYQLADLFLDTLPVNGHTTVSDALWAGLPVLTCTGATFAGRVASSLLHAVSLGELVTASLAEYEALAIELALTPTRLAEIRAWLRENGRAEPLFDTERYTRCLEYAYLEMLERHRSGEAPDHIVVPTIVSALALRDGECGVTVITPTTGRRSLLRLIESVDAERRHANITHLLLWDDKREPDAPDPAQFNSETRRSLVLPAGFGRFGDAPGSALRSVGLLLATSAWTTFADDDVSWEAGHLEALLGAARGRNWATTLRRVWANEIELLGVDRFESVGDDPGRKVSYEMCDNNCMLFRRELGVAAAPLFRETRDYNDDRLLYGYLKEYAGERGKTGIATINQICPEQLIEFFRSLCSHV